MGGRHSGVCTVIRQKRHKIVLAFAFGLLTTTSFNNCGQFETNPDLAGLMQYSIRTGTAPSQVAVQSADQIARSMSSVTGVEIDATILGEISARRALMTDNWQVDSVNAPMLIGITNVASRFCDQLQKKELAIASEQRQFFSGVVATSGPDQISDAQIETIADRMAYKFLGRNLASEEKAILREGINDWKSSLPAGGMTNRAQVPILLNFMCTSMLASFEFITL